ncbi:MAG: hypothetical protein HYS05_16965, partial [Acidobacteria bacterium]|nr:hypothetical protein [Acidobacteriota bacterium]
QQHASIGLVVTEPASAGKNILTDYCRRAGIPVVETNRLNQPEAVDLFRRTAPDLLFSINNFKIIKEPLLAIPADGTVNFHNGPLPRYGGVNPCSWAIVNGEVEHGVTWHYVDVGIDTGEIIAQSRFPIGARDTAGGLTVRCILEGVRLFGDIVSQIVDGTAPRIPQDRTNASYYSLKDVPNQGVIDFSWTLAELDRFVRALSFYPLKNTLAYPKATCRSRTFYVERVVPVVSGKLAASWGTVVEIWPDRIDVQVADGVVGLTSVLDDERRTMKIVDFASSYGLAAGTLFDGAAVLQETM